MQEVNRTVDLNKMFRQIALIDFRLIVQSEHTVFQGIFINVYCIMISYDS